MLAGVDLRVERGEVFALLGQNGAGKTTTVRILSTLTRPTAARPASAAATWSPSGMRCAAGSPSPASTWPWTSC